MADEAHGDTETTTTSSSDDGGTAADEGKTVPYKRFRDVIEERNKANADLAELRAQVVELKATHGTELEKLQGEVREAQEKASRLEADGAWSSSLVELAKDGITDPEITDYLRYKYDHHGVAEGEERPSFSDWYTTYKEAEPAVLKPFLGSADTSKGGTTTSSRSRREAPSKSTTDGTRAPKDIAGLDPASIATMSREEYAAHRQALLAKVGGRSP